ncbi:MAG TPA: hypothetical protein DDW65_04800 [Firmicutes bacterium]|nr:hypothetical protein [Bacillota bacterium]
MPLPSGACCEAGRVTFQWIQCQKGQGQLIIKDQSHLVDSEQDVFLYPNQAHEYFEINEPWKLIG